MLVLRRLLRRSLASKDPADLRKEFEQLKQAAEPKASPTPQQPEIKVTDQKQREELLKDQFKDLTQGLEKETGEAKSAYQRMKESYESMQAPDFTGFTASFREKLRKKEKPRPPPDPAAKTNEESKAEKEGKEENKAKSKGKVPLSQKFPVFSPIFTITQKTSDYVVDSFKETFPTTSYKMEKALKRQQKMMLEKEMMEKFMRGDIQGDDASIPDWKRGALQPVEVKKSIFQKAKDSVKSSVFGAKIESATQQIIQSPHLKSVKEGLGVVKAGIEDIKEGVKEDIDAADNKLLNKMRDSWSNSTFETQEAKAVKLLRAYDSEFDVFALEDMMDGIVEDLLKKFDARDMAAIETITDGPARHWFKSELSYESEVTPHAARRHPRDRSRRSRPCDLPRYQLRRQNQAKVLIQCLHPHVHRSRAQRRLLRLR